MQENPTTKIAEAILNERLVGKTIAFVEPVQVGHYNGEPFASRAGDPHFRQANGWKIGFTDGTAVYTDASYSDSSGELVFDPAEGKR